MKQRRKLKSSGGSALPVRADVANEDDVSSMVKKTLDRFKRIDILVANAATNRPAPFMKMPLKIWDEIIRVNIRGVTVCAKAVLPAMIEQGEGHIITISSVLRKNSIMNLSPVSPMMSARQP